MTASNGANPVFYGTASYYSAYRPLYPASVIDWVRGLAPHGGALLDIGCGPGTLTMQLAPYFDPCLGLDIDPGMIAEAQDQIRARGITNVRFEVRAAENIASLDIRPGLATFGTSFHWMDRPSVARDVRAMMAENGALAIVTAFSLWRGNEPWKKIVYDLIRLYTGEDRTSGKGQFENARPHEAVLKDAGFAEIETASLHEQHTYSCETLLGFLHSTSFASRAALGGKADDFARELEAALRAHDPENRFTETIEYNLVAAKKS